MAASSLYFIPLFSKQTIVSNPGEYLTRSGEVVTISNVSTKHDFGCVGFYPNGICERWHKSGRIHAGIECGNDIVCPKD